MRYFASGHKNMHRCGLWMTVDKSAVEPLLMVSNQQLSPVSRELPPGILRKVVLRDGLVVRRAPPRRDAHQRRAGVHGRARVRGHLQGEGDLADHRTLSEVVSKASSEESCLRKTPLDVQPCCSGLRLSLNGTCLVTALIVVTIAPCVPGSKITFQLLLKIEQP